MDENTKVNTDETQNEVPVVPVAEAKTAAPRDDRGPFRKAAGGPRGGHRPGSRPGGRGGFERPKPEFDQKILAIRRVTRVVAGGRRMSFSVAMAIGDKKGSVGLGTGKATDTSLAIAKALKDAKRNMLKLKLTKTLSLPHDVRAKYSSSEVMLFPNHGRGMVAGSAIRDLLVLAGVHDISAKVLTGSKNKLNIGRAVLKALATLAAPKKSMLAEAPKVEAFVIPEDK